MSSNSPVQDFPTPWESFPDIPRFSIGWRMGDPEEALFEWFEKYSALNIWEQREYRRRHRLPKLLWLGFYSLHSKHRLVVATGAVSTLLVFFLLFVARIIAGPFAADRVKLD